ncbi:MAG: hypothetical protein OXL68_20410, partial [Paracoccaceae bacterium]|nr:hypothetical protein [Paracoccaceae bacterium]
MDSLLQGINRNPAWLGLCGFNMLLVQRPGKNSSGQWVNPVPNNGIVWRFLRALADLEAELGLICAMAEDLRAAPIAEIPNLRRHFGCGPFHWGQGQAERQGLQSGCRLTGEHEIRRPRPVSYAQSARNAVWAPLCFEAGLPAVWSGFAGMRPGTKTVPSPVTCETARQGGRHGHHRVV